MNLYQNKDHTGVMLINGNILVFLKGITRKIAFVISYLFISTVFNTFDLIRPEKGSYQTCTDRLRLSTRPKEGYVGPKNTSR